MRFVLHSIGSTGDILPFVALGHHLKQDGHSVVAGFDPNAGAIAKSVGLKYAPVGPSPDFAQATNILLSMSKIADEAEHWDKFLQSMTGACRQFTPIFSSCVKMLIA